MRLREMDIVAVALLGLVLSGCSATHWMGTGVNQPGTEFEGATAFRGPRLRVNSNAHAKVKGIKARGATKTQPSEFSMEEGEFGQKPSESLPMLPALVTASSQGQRTQTEYQAVFWQGFGNVVGQVTDAFTLMKALGVQQTSKGFQFTLPNNMSIGGQVISTPADAMKLLDNLTGALKTLKEKAPIATQPSSQ